MLGGIYQALSEQHVVVPGTEVVGLAVPRLVQQLSTLRTQREDPTREVEVRVHAHPVCPVLMSLPGGRHQDRRTTPDGGRLPRRQCQEFCVMRAG